jgi:hypothetical protein
MHGINIDKNGNKFYYWNDRYHREDGPAIEFSNGNKWWYLHDLLHREDGPAVEYADGYKEWYLQNKQYTEEEYWRILKLKTLW